MDQQNFISKINMTLSVIIRKLKHKFPDQLFNLILLSQFLIKSINLKKRPQCLKIEMNKATATKSLTQ